MRISIYFFLLFSLIVVFPIANAYAQSETATPDNQSTEDQNISGEIEIDKARIDDLINTLENEEQRQEFIGNLKTLVAVDEEQNAEQATAILDLSTATGGFIAQYDEFVANLGISEGLFGQIIASCGIIILWVVFIFLVRKLAYLLKDRLNRLKDKYQLSHDRFRLYARYIRFAGYILVTAITVYTMAVVWNLAEGDLSIGETGQVILSNLLNIFVVTLVAIIIWEVINTTIESYIKKLDSSHSSRMLTLIPIIRNIFFIAFLILFTLVLLSEIGVNVVPLLAGAGVLGIAIGLGAQTMIKDFLTGFTIILEDLIQVGDVASVGGKTGLIERITIRKVQLRDQSGTVFTVPFSEITIIENLTKDFSFYLMDIGVAYRENTDDVIGYLKEIDEDLRSEEHFQNLILEPIEIMGVDRFADSAVIIKARIKTKPIKQWEVGREFNRRMKIKFDAMNVEIPFPHQTIYFGEDKHGKAPAAPIEILEHKEKKSLPKQKLASKTKKNKE